MSTTDTLQPARVRFAPSPTGFLHLGGLRTALFDWLWARRTGGQFILRIEDTDQKRYNPESLDDLMAGLRWLGLDWDEGPDVGGPYGPYVQSQRKDLYRPYAEDLLARGLAYKSYSPLEEWEAANPDDVEPEVAGARKPYDRRDRFLTPEQRAALDGEGRPYAIRFAAPLEGTTVVPDLMRGDVTFKNENLVDQVLLKSDGMPTYHLAMVVDDHLMQITHVLRGEEWLSSAPIHKLLFDAFGWEMPTLVHMSVILDPSGKGKMSKRKKVVDGKEYLALVREFRQAGYVPNALFNFLTNIGWNFGDEREIFDREEAIERFDLAQLNPAPAALPYAKLEWMNGQYIRAMESRALARHIAPAVAAAVGLSVEAILADDRLVKLTPLIQERIKTLIDAPEWVDWAYKDADEITYPDPSLLLGRKLDAAQSAQILQASAEMLAAMDDFSAPGLEAAFRAKAEELDVKFGALLGPVRAAISGKPVSPPLFESLEVLGKEQVLRRLANARQILLAQVEAG